MADVAVFTGDVKVVDGDLRLSGTDKRIYPDIPSTWLEQRPAAVFPIDLASLFVFDSGQPLPATPASDDLGLVPGTHGTDCPIVSAGDVKAAGATTRKARFLLRVPANFEAGQSLTLRASAGNKTTIADTSSTLDFEAYKVGRDTLKSGSDLISTSATSIRSTTFANKDFTITSSGLVAGDVLDVLMTIATTDSATATAVIPCVAALDLLADVR